MAFNQKINLITLGDYSITKEKKLVFEDLKDYIKVFKV